MGRLILALGRQGRIETSAGSSIPMDEGMADDPVIAKMLAEVNQKWAGQGAAEVIQAKGPAFVGAAGCRACHKAQYDQWLKTPHARAFASLEREKRLNRFKPDCVSCHTVGFGQPGGFESLERTPALANVQCENCHGEGRLHVVAGPEQKKGTAIRVPRPAMCVKCHHEPNDLDFDYEKKLPLVKH